MQETFVVMKTRVLVALLVLSAAVPIGCLAQRANTQPVNDRQRAAAAEASTERETAALVAVGRANRIAAMKTALLAGRSYGADSKERLRKARDEGRILVAVEAGYTPNAAKHLDRLGYPLLTVFSREDPRISDTHREAFASERVVIASVTNEFYEDRGDGLLTTVVLRVDEDIAGRGASDLVLRLWSGRYPDGSGRSRSTEPLDWIVGEQYLLSVSTLRYAMVKDHSTGEAVTPTDQLVMLSGITQLMGDVDPETLKIYREVGQLRAKAAGEIR
jgi:hypothetical protein